MDVVLLILTTLSLAARRRLRRAVLADRPRGARTRAARESPLFRPPWTPAGLRPARLLDSRPRRTASCRRIGVRPGRRRHLRGRPLIRVAVGGDHGARDCHRCDHRRSKQRTDAVVRPARPRRSNWCRCAISAQGTTLTVSGLVRNPGAGAAVNGVTAVVFAFDRDGAFVASGRAPLDFGALAPGDESPFVVTVPERVRCRALPRQLPERAPASSGTSIGAAIRSNSHRL